MYVQLYIQQGLHISMFYYRMTTDIFHKSRVEVDNTQSNDDK